MQIWTKTGTFLAVAKIYNFPGLYVLRNGFKMSKNFSACI